jgi:hypothetical protein
LGIDLLMMKRRISIITTILVWVLTGLLPVAATKQPVFDVRQPTILAFFTPVTKAELNDGETNESLADFQYYAKRIRQPLQQEGIEFHEVYARSFQLRIGKTLITFHPEKADVGYYLVSPGKKPRVEYGVLTDTDLLEIAHKYFGIPSK